MASSGDLTKVFLVSCDARIEDKVQTLISQIQAANGKITLKTINNVPEAKGADFGKKLETLLSWAKCVLVICSDNLAAFIDKKDSSNCPDIIKNEKNCLKILKNFLEKQMKATPNKILLVSVSGSNALPRCLTLPKGMSVIENNESGDTFVKRIVAEIEGK